MHHTFLVVTVKKWGVNLRKLSQN